MPSNRIVHGLLWDITSEHAADLDEYEGVAFGSYSKVKVRVRRPDQGAVEALVYVAANSEAGQPRRGYLGLIVAAARAHGFPADYVAELEAWQDATT